MKIRFKTKDKVTIVGTLSKPKPKTGTCIILCHGATVDKDEESAFSYLSKRLTDAGFANFRFDFRGHGESGCKSVDMTIEGQGRDLNSALNCLKSMGYKQFAILGASFSGIVVSLYSASHKDKIKAVIFWNSVLDTSKLLKRWLGGDQKEYLKVKGFITRHNVKYGRALVNEIRPLKPWKELRKIKKPMLFVHGDKDSTLPYKDSVRFAKMTGSKMVIVHGSEHGFHTRKHSKLAADAVVRFLSENFDME